MVRPNPRFDPVAGSTVTPTAPRQPRPNPRYGDDGNVILFEDKFVLIDGYQRNLVLEKKIQDDYDNIKQYTNYDEWSTPIPAGWDLIGTGINKGGGWRREGSIAGVTVTDQEAINYLELVIRIAKPKLAQQSYNCEYYPRDTSSCQSANHTSSMIQNAEKLLDRVKMQQRYPKVPEREILDNPDVYTVNSSSTSSSLIYGVQEPFEIIPEASTQEEIIQEPFEIIPQASAQEEIIQKPVINESITDNMIIQKLNNFSIINGRAIGSISFIATENFNPFYYGKNLTTVIQFKTPNGVNILPFIKQNTLRFTETERDETIHYDESMQSNTRATLESFTWSSVTQPTAFSKKLSYEISETEAPKPVGVTGIMGAGVAGAIGILILLGFITDSRRKR